MCPGSFDPVTNGHIDVFLRAAGAVRRARRRRAGQPGQVVDVHRRGAHGAAASRLADVPNIPVDTFQGLLVDYCRAHDILAIVKGLRAVSDFDYELQMAQMNRSWREIETLFIPTEPQDCYLSSCLVKEVATYGGDVSGWSRRRRRPAARTGRPGRDPVTRPGRTHTPRRLPALRDPRRADHGHRERPQRADVGQVRGPPQRGARPARHVRESLPEDVQAAGAIVEQRTEILQQAQAEAERLTGQTRDEAEHLLEAGRRQRDELLGVARRQPTSCSPRRRPTPSRSSSRPRPRPSVLVAEAARQPRRWSPRRRPSTSS